MRKLKSFIAGAMSALMLATMVSVPVKAEETETDAIEIVGQESHDVNNMFSDDQIYRASEGEIIYNNFSMFSDERMSMYGSTAMFITAGIPYKVKTTYEACDHEISPNSFYLEVTKGKRYRVVVSNPNEIGALRVSLSFICDNYEEDYTYSFGLENGHRILDDSDPEEPLEYITSEHILVSELKRDSAGQAYFEFIPEKTCVANVYFWVDYHMSSTCLTCEDEKFQWQAIGLTEYNRHNPETYEILDTQIYNKERDFGICVSDVTNTVYNANCGHIDKASGGNWDGTSYTNPDGQKVVNAFFSDGTYTYFLDAYGNAMKDRLTYHPDGVHVIYFDEKGHEVFSNFAHVKKAIAGNAVDDYCFFDVYGYMYVDVMTYDTTGKKLYYVNPYGQIERKGWFKFSNTAVWAGTTKKVGTGWGYGQSDGTLMINKWTTNKAGKKVYMQGDGHMK